MTRDALERLSKEELIAPVLARAAQIEVLTRRVAELEARLGKPAKTPRNSSLPPSQGEKADRPETPKKPRVGRPGSFRALAENPDRTVEAFAPSCPHCQHTLTPADQPDFHAYDHLDLPPIRPVVTRVNRHRGGCPGCRKSFAAAAPAGLEPGSPFGPNLVALIVHLHVTQAIGFERLVVLLDEVFGVEISEGAIADLLARVQAPLVAAAEAVGEEVRKSPVIASDEPSARVTGKKWWQWVLLSGTAIYHIIADTRAAETITRFLQGTVPEIWVADRYGGQAGHGRERQLCLAHLVRDAQYAIDEGDREFAPGLRMLLLRAIGRRRDDLKDSTLKQYRGDLDRRLDRLLARQPTTPAARRLRQSLLGCREDLFRFMTRRDVPYTNNACERALRPSVIFRKVTGCFRSSGGAKLYAAAVSVIATGRLRGLSARQAIMNVLFPPSAPQAARPTAEHGHKFPGPSPLDTHQNTGVSSYDRPLDPKSRHCGGGEVHAS